MTISYISCRRTADVSICLGKADSCYEALFGRAEGGWADAAPPPLHTLHTRPGKKTKQKSYRQSKYKNSIEKLQSVMYIYRICVCVCIYVHVGTYECGAVLLALSPAAVQCEYWEGEEEEEGWGGVCVWGGRGLLAPVRLHHRPLCLDGLRLRHAWLQTATPTAWAAALIT